jgi:hypothetical protein
MRWAVTKAGTPYGTKECIGLAWVKICSIFGKKIKNPFVDNGQTYVCSELAAYVLQEFAGDVLPQEIENMTPLDVYNLFKNLKEIK